MERRLAGLGQLRIKREMSSISSLSGHEGAYGIVPRQAHTHWFQCVLSTQLWTISVLSRCRGLSAYLHGALKCALLLTHYINAEMREFRSPTPSDTADDWESHILTGSKAVCEAQTPAPPLPGQDS